LKCIDSSSTANENPIIVLSQYKFGPGHEPSLLLYFLDSPQTG